MENLCVLCESRLAAIKKSQLCMRCYQRVRYRTLHSATPNEERRQAALLSREEHLRLAQLRREARAADTLERHRPIIELALAGATLRSIAEQKGMTHQRVAQILARHGIRMRDLKAPKPKALPPPRPSREQLLKERTERVRARFLASIEVDPSTNCWNWTGPLDVPSPSYPGNVIPRMNAPDPLDARRSRRTAGQRVAYMLFVGPIPDGMLIGRKCHNALCCNPDHLEALTRVELGKLKNPAKMETHVKQTHCKYGHEYTEANTYWAPQGGRQCRICLRRRERAYREKKGVKGS